MTYLRTTPIQELVSITEFIELNSRELDRNAENWRWFILALHLGVQAALICALKGHDTSGVSILSGPSARRTMEWLEAPRPRGPEPNQQVAPMRELLKRVQQLDYLPDPNRLVLPQNKIDDVLRLIDLRNQFAHFAVDGWSLEISGLPRIATHCLDVVEHLVLREPTFWHRLEPGDRERIDRALSRTNERLRVWASREAQVAK